MANTNPPLPLRTYMPGMGFECGIDSGINTGVPETMGSSGQSISVPLTTAQILGMSATPVSILPTTLLTTGQGFIVTSWSIKVFSTSFTAFAGGGVIVLQYGNTALGAGTAAAATMTAANITSATNALGNAVDVTLAAVPLNTALFISNQTGAFTTGTGNAIVYVWYQYV